MNFILAYGLPASGKTTFLLEQQGIYLDLDNKKVPQIRSILESLPENTYILDFFIRDINKFICFLQSLYPKCYIKVFNIITSREICLERDNLRPKYRRSENIIKSYKLPKIQRFINLENHSIVWKMI